jgi:hypothetical protein
MTIVVAAKDSEVSAMSVGGLTETREFATIPTRNKFHYALVKTDTRGLYFYEVDKSGVAQGSRSFNMGSGAEVAYLVWALNCNAALMGCR